MHDETNNFAFQDCILVPNGTMVKTFLKSLHIDLEKNLVNIETVGGIKISENHILSKQMNVIKITTVSYDEKK